MHATATNWLKYLEASSGVSLLSVREAPSLELDSKEDGKTANSLSGEGDLAWLGS